METQRLIKLDAHLRRLHFSKNSPIRRHPLLRLRGCGGAQNTTSLTLFSPSPQAINPIPRRFIIVQTTYCTNISSDSPSISSNDDENGSVLAHQNILLPSDLELVRNATWIGVATLTSKFLGLVREVVMASVFGIGSVATAYKYASVLPGFAASLLGGVNGPIHITAATSMSKLPKDRQRKLFRHINTIMFMVGGVVSALIYVFSELIVHVYAPGLWILTEGRITRELAIKQLRIMTPCILLAGPVGFGFGYMSAEGSNVLPSVSPALSSLVMIGSCVIFSFIEHSNASFSGGILISCVSSLGIFLQWILQVTVLCETWSDIFPDSWVNMLNNQDVPEFFSLLIPATFSSGLAQIASFTDLCFASLVPGAVAGLSYAYLLVMTPLGLLSSMIVLPLLPIFSKLIKTGSWSTLAENLKQAVLLCMVVLLPMLSIMYVLAEPIICILFERNAFDSSATALVSSLFRCYSIGSPFLLVRELLIAVFYALGDGQAPFLVSMAAIALNAILDWLMVSKYYLGAHGLALSTSLTTALSVVVLYYLLQRKLSGVLDYAALIRPTLLLSFCCVISSFTTFISYKVIASTISSSFTIRLYWLRKLLVVCLASSLGIIGFFLPVIVLHNLGFKLVKDFSRIFMDIRSSFS